MPDQQNKRNQIFISYRREDTAGVVGRIYDRLVQRFGKDAIFKDVDSIPLGKDFRRHIDSAVSDCRLALVVVGDRWMASAGTRASRLDDPRDYVRIEIEAVLKRDIPVIPLLVQNASLPSDENLPESIRDFTYRNGMSIGHDPLFHADMDRLIKHLEEFIEERPHQEDRKSFRASTRGTTSEQVGDNKPSVPSFSEPKPLPSETAGPIFSDANQQAESEEAEAIVSGALVQLSRAGDHVPENLEARKGAPSFGPQPAITIRSSASHKKAIDGILAVIGFIICIAIIALIAGAIRIPAVVVWFGIAALVAILGTIWKRTRPENNSIGAIRPENSLIGAMKIARRKVLVVDDDKNQREIYTLILEDDGYQVTTAQSGEQALRFARENQFDLVLTDYKMSGMDGLTLLSELLKLDPSNIVVMMTAHGSVDSVKEALRHGAFDYLAKPVERDQLVKVVQNALVRLNRIDDEIIGESEEMKRVKKMILKVAGSTSTVMIRGESGVGKRRVARAIQKASPRANEVFQAVNCAAINENLIESELFGHERGSVIGAHGQKRGQFEIANRGTLFLDEIGDLNVSMQAKILRALQEKEIMRVGGVKPIKVNVRVVAATNRDLEAMVKEGLFREDLYYRLNTIPIVIPPLRYRGDDIPTLVDFFIAKHEAGFPQPVRRLTPAARNLMMTYSWPGNVRQLESAIEHAILLCESNQIGVEDLPVEIRQEGTSAGAFNLTG